MKRAGKRGEVYLPVYERLELAALKARQSAMTTEDEDEPRKSHIPLKDRLSLSPQEASALTGIGNYLHSTSHLQRLSGGQEAG